MRIDALRCPSCGAALTNASLGPQTCAYCSRVIVVSPSVGGEHEVDLAEPERHPGRPRLEIAGRRFVVLGQLAQGESSDVFMGCSDQRLSERVVIKILRSVADADLLDAEWSTIERLLGSSAQGSPYFRTLIPQPVVHGLARGSTLPERPASVFCWRSGFVSTLDDVRRAFPKGVSPAAGAWMWKRLLELLGWVHQAGFTHGAVLPRHVLIHPRDHGATLVGWSCAAPWGLQAPLRARVTGLETFYPEVLRRGGASTAETDLTLTARCVVHALGGDAARGEPPTSLPGPLSGLLRASARMEMGPGVEAWALKEQVVIAARAALGPSRFEPLSMPGWNPPAH